MSGRGGTIGHLAEDVIKPLFKKSETAAEDVASVSRKRKYVSVKDDPYQRPSGYRKGVRDKVYAAHAGRDGVARDPVTKAPIPKDGDWDMGHKPGWEFRKHAQSARERDLSRKQFLDEHNDPRHYRPELPSSNRSHQGEDHTGDYAGP